MRLLLGNESLTRFLDGLIKPICSCMQPYAVAETCESIDARRHRPTDHAAL